MRGQVLRNWSGAGGEEDLFLEGTGFEKLVWGQGGRGTYLLRGQVLRNWSGAGGTYFLRGQVLRNWSGARGGGGLIS